MSWKDTLLDASFRGVPFDCQRTDDVIEREVARYGYPNVDGEDLVDQGQKARETSLTAVFFGDDYETRMNAFLNAIAQTGPGELVHPVFGSLPNMQYLGGHVSHDAENPDACFMELRFAKATPGNPFFVQQLTGQRADATAQTAQTAQDAGVSVFANAMAALTTARTSLRRLNALRDVLSETLGPIKNLVTGFQTTTLDYIDYPRAFASDLIGLVSGMADLRSFDSGLVLSDWDGLLDQLKVVVQLPSSAVGSTSTVIPGTVTAATATASSTAQSQAATANTDDVAIVSALVTTVVATTLASVVSDVLANEIDTPTLTPDDIEQITGEVRTQLQSAIDQERDTVDLVDSRPVTEPLKDTALAVQQLAIEVIDQLPPIVSRTVTSPASLTLIAFHWYGDYTRSSELIRLNPTLRNPNFIDRGQVLRGYAK